MAAEQTGFASPPYRLAQAQGKWHTVTKNSGEASLQGYHGTAVAQTSRPAGAQTCVWKLDRGPALTQSLAVASPPG